MSMRKLMKFKFIPRGLPREQNNGGLPRGRSVALPLGQARGSYPVRSQKLIIKHIVCWTIICLFCAFFAGCKPKHEVITGYVEGRLSFIATSLAGDLVNLYVKRGDPVVIGQKLFMLEERPENDIIKQLQAEISDLLVRQEQANSNLEHAKLLFSRREALVAKHVISEEDFDLSRIAKQNALAELNSVKSRLDIARAKLAEAKWNQENKLVKAEKNGIVFDTYFLPTEFVPAGKPVLSILSNQDKYIVFYVPGASLYKFKAQQKVLVTCDGVLKPFNATISFIYPKVEFSPPIIYTDKSRTSLLYKVEANVDIDANEACLHIGQPVDIIVPN
jgi:HlyD family secretion protein